MPRARVFNYTEQNFRLAKKKKTFFFYNFLFGKPLLNSCSRTNGETVNVRAVTDTPVEGPRENRFCSPFRRKACKASTLRHDEHLKNKNSNTFSSKRGRITCTFLDEPHRVYLSIAEDSWGLIGSGGGGDGSETR